MKTILIRLAFSLVVSFICKKAKESGKPWHDDFCEFCKGIQLP